MMSPVPFSDVFTTEQWTTPCGLLVNNVGWNIENLYKRKCLLCAAFWYTKGRRFNFLFEIIWSVRTVIAQWERRIWNESCCLSEQKRRLLEAAGSLVGAHGLTAAPECTSRERTGQFVWRVRGSWRWKCHEAAYARSIAPWWQVAGLRTNSPSKLLIFKHLDLVQTYTNICTCICVYIYTHIILNKINHFHP